MIDFNNKRKNKKIITFEYKIDNEVLINRSKGSKDDEKEHDRPHTILGDCNIGTLRMRKDIYSDIVNIRNCYPYFG